MHSEILFDVTEKLERRPSHPGDVLEDIILDVQHSKSELAQILGISRQQFHDILAARRPVSPTIAARIGRVFGGGAGLWLRLQANFDAWQADRDVSLNSLRKLVPAA